MSQKFPKLIKLCQIFDFEDVHIVAHNAYFEQVITQFVFRWRTLKHTRFKRNYLEDIPPERWICTAARAAALALPRNLEAACEVLKLPVQKDKEGKRLIQRLCKTKKAHQK